MRSFVVGLVGLMLALQSASGKSVSSVPGCEPEVLLDCTKRLEYLNSDTALDLGASQQDLEKVCPTLQEGMQCINGYSNKCLPENIQVYFQSMYNGTISVISELCRAGDFQDEYLKHAPCMDKAKAEYKQCVDEYNGVMGRINPLEKERRSSNIKIMCCSFSEYIECSNQLVLKRCGADTADFTRSLLDRLASPIIQEHCYRHFDGKKECGGIMATLRSGDLPDADSHDHDHHKHQHIDGGHDDHSSGTGGKKGGSPFDGAVANGEPSPGDEESNDGNDIGSGPLRESADAEPSTNAAASSSSRWGSFLASSFFSGVLLFIAL